MDQNQQVPYIRQAYSLYEITESISRMFSKHYASPYWIKAEISKLNLYPHSGHCYPDLVERINGKVKSQVRGIIWRDDLHNISRKFEETTREPMREGINIMFQAWIKYSSEYGLSLQIIDIEPLFTLGELAKEKMETLDRLKKEGIFYNNGLLQMPLLPKRLAVISASTSKGYSDLMVTLKDNRYGYRFHVQLFHALLQGDGAVESIRNQLLAIKKKYTQFDAVLIIRGGGDEIGMACYDHYSLAREVACFPIPVISGIGHSTNETVVEMVSNINKITPTDVAHYLIGCFQTFDQRIQNAFQMLQLASKAILETSKNHFSQTSNHFALSSQTFVNQEKEILGQTARVIRDSVNSSVFNHRMALGRFENALQSEPYRIVQQHQINLLQHQKLLQLHNNLLLKKNNTLLENLEHKVKILDPQSVIKRGFTITRHAGKPIPPGFVPEEGLAIETEHLNGKFTSIITKK